MYQNIEELTLSILNKLEVTQIPIPIKLVAEKWGLQIRPYDLGANVSGVLFLRSGLGIIGYNPSEPPVRQRFTIAHELGHYELHRSQGELFVDKTDQAQKVYLMKEASSTGELKK